MRVAVITPYCHEDGAVLRRCHESVLAQTYPATHVMIADGPPRAPVPDTWAIEHIALPQRHQDSGNTPRCIGSLSAINRDVDAVAYLDADNWYRPDHLERMVALHQSTGAAVCTANRTIHRKDGSVMYWDLDSDGVRFVDASCYFLTRGAFRLAALWGWMPKPLAPIGDRIFWLAVSHSGLSHAHSREATVAFTTRYADHYAMCGEPPPPGAVTTAEFNRPIEWWEAQSAEFRADWYQFFEKGGW